MWSCDIICDVPWLKEQKGDLGDPAYKVGGKSPSLGGAIEVLLFSDGTCLRHVRFVLHTENQETAQKCVDSNISAWVDSIESGVILQTRRSFQVPRLEGTYGLVTILSKYDGNQHVTGYLELSSNKIEFDAKTIGASLALWRPDLYTHLHYFRKMIDPALPLELRWLNAYKLFEWHFAKRDLARAGKKKELVDSDEWKAFVKKYHTQFTPLLKPNQTLFGLIEQVRAMVAHAYFSDTTGSFPQAGNLFRSTFPIMRDMVNDLLNSCQDPYFPVRLTQ